MTTYLKKKCEYCGETYDALRHSNKYCSDSCKTMACRARKKKDGPVLIDQQHVNDGIAYYQRWMREQNESYQKFMDEHNPDKKANQEIQNIKDAEQKINNPPIQKQNNTFKQESVVKKPNEPIIQVKVDKLINLVIEEGFNFIKEEMSKPPKNPDEGLRKQQPEPDPPEIS